MVHRRQVFAFADRWQQALQLRADLCRSVEHTHLVKAANHEEIGVQITDLGHVHAGLALQRQDTVDTRLDEPGHRAGNIAVGINEHTGAVFLDFRNQAAVIWQKKFIISR